MKIHPLVSTVLVRLGLGALTLFIVSVVIFGGLQLLPGDFAEAILGQEATPEVVAALRRSLRLNELPIVTYFAWLGAVLQGDFGSSFAGRSSGVDRQVADLILPRLRNTLFLSALTAAIAVPLALTLGVLAALHRNTIFDRAINMTSLGAVSVPEFFIGYILVLLLAAMWPIFPAVANIRPNMPLGDRMMASALPALTLTLVIVAHMMRMTRAAILDLMARPYIEMAKLKGMSQLRIILKHAFPNALAPIVTVIAFNLAYLVVGVVVVEVVFVYPGIGQLMVNSVASRDIPVVQACALLFASTYIVLNLVADIIAIVSNPRLMHPR